MKEIGSRDEEREVGRWMRKRRRRRGREETRKRKRRREESNRIGV